jgi:hypothetical protein
MMLAQAYYNRYITFTTSLSFLNSFEGNIAAVIESRSSDDNIFSFSDSTISNLFGGFYYNKGYDPREVKEVIDNVASFAALFSKGEDAKKLPLFLQNVDRKIYQPQPFMEYLESYIAYWGNYPERVYISAGSWDRFLARATEYKSFQINSVLLSVYTTCTDALNKLDNALLNESLLALKNKYTASVGDSLGLLGQFYSADAEKMFSHWNKLSVDPLEAYTFLKSLPEDDLKNSYLSVYTTGKDTLGIGWWNNFVIDGLSILARYSDAINMAQLIQNVDSYKAYPLCADAPRAQALSLDKMKEIASLFKAMGADIPDTTGQTEIDPVAFALHHNLFKGLAVQTWAKTICQIAAAAASEQNPLTWTVYQIPVDIQENLPGRRELLAINRFRYVKVTSADTPPRASSTYMKEKLSLMQSNPDSAPLKFDFYKTSRDIDAGAVITFDGPWSIFELYLQNNRIADNSGNSYIPVYLQDESGRYVYCLEVGFNQEMPDYSSWYAQANWPNIAIADNTITARR